MRSVEASDRTEPYQGHVNRPARVSPELAEFLHMLNSSRIIWSPRPTPRSELLITACCDHDHFRSLRSGAET